MLNSEMLISCLPEASRTTANEYAAAISAACQEFQIDTPLRLASFLAQIGHESGNLKYFRENTNYTSDGMMVVFPQHFTYKNAKEYHRKPEKIANRVYANRMGNGDEASGDGWRYRGRGFIQLTGKNNYEACGTGIGVDLIANPEYLETVEGASRSAAWFWKSRGLNDLADVYNMRAITLKINGGYNGFTDRMELYEITKTALGVH